MRQEAHVAVEVAIPSQPRDVDTTGQPMAMALEHFQPRSAAHPQRHNKNYPLVQRKAAYPGPDVKITFLPATRRSSPGPRLRQS